MSTVRQRVKVLAAATITIVSIYFLATALRESWISLKAIFMERRVIVAILALSIVYCATFYVSFGAWFYTLRRNSETRVSFTSAARLYGICNIYKYIPGSVFHFAGRQILGAKFGWGQASIARATLLEVGAMASGAGFAALAIAWTPIGGGAVDATLAAWGLQSIPWRSLSLTAVGISGIIFVVAARTGITDRLFAVSPTTILNVVALNVLYFALYAAMAAVLTLQFTGNGMSPDLARIAIAFLVSWLTGYILPGAPSGIGVREGMLVLLLANGTDSGNALALALGFGLRCVNTLGDLAFTGVTLALDRPTSPHPSLTGVEGQK